MMNNIPVDAKNNIVNKSSNLVDTSVNKSNNLVDAPSNLVDAPSNLVDTSVNKSSNLIDHPVDHPIDHPVDNETYINIDKLISDDINEIYQIQLNNNFLELKHVGTGTHIPEIIIKENFGVDNSFNLYNCLYSRDELDNIFNDGTGSGSGSESGSKTDTDQYSNIFLPIIKLVKNYPINDILEKNLNKGQNINQDINQDQEPNLNQDLNQIFSISVKISDFTGLNKLIDKFQLYLTNNIKEKVWFQKLEPNINSSNIIEKMIESIIELGIKIL